MLKDLLEELLLTTFDGCEMNSKMSNKSLAHTFQILYNIMQILLCF